MKIHFAMLAGSAILLASCGQAPEEAAQDRLEDQAEASAVAAGPAEAALGLSEAQLLDADLRGPNDVDLGDIEAVLRDAQGVVDRLVVEIDGSDPDRFVEIPIGALTTVVRGDDTDLSTTMTKEQLAALPSAVLPNVTVPTTTP